MPAVLHSPGSPRTHLRSDALAGLTAAVAALPNAMAAAALAGLSPVHGIHAVALGGVLSAFTMRSVLVSIGVTGAIALTVRHTLAGTGAERIGILVTLTLLVGLLQIAFGLLRVGNVLKFVSHSVMVGFLSGIGVLIVLSQLGNLTGYRSDADHVMARVWDIAVHADRIDPRTLLVGATTIGLILALDRLPIRPASMLVALVAIGLATHLLGWTSVPRIADVAGIPRSLPRPAFPIPSAVPQLLVPALGIALLGLVQTAGVAQSTPNPDGRYGNPSGDIVGQGLINACVGIFRGMPVGGSLGATLLTVSAGARSGWANIFASVLVLVLALAFSRPLGRLPLATLAGILVLAGYRAIAIGRIVNVWKTGWIARAALSGTFLATLVLPLQHAILVGVGLSFMLHVIRSADHVRLREVAIENGALIERDPPANLPSRRMTVLLPYGSLFFAGVRMLALPRAEGARRAVVIFLMRGRRDVGSTFIQVLTSYARAIERGHGRLLLVGASEEVCRQLDRTGALDAIGRENVFPATTRYGEALMTAIAAASAWLAQGRIDESRDDADVFA